MRLRLVGAGILLCFAMVVPWSATAGASAENACFSLTRDGATHPGGTGLRPIESFFSSFDDFCNEPYLALCSAKIFGPEGRKQRVEQLRQQVRAAAMRDTALWLQAIGKWSGDPATFTVTNLAAVSPEAVRQLAFIRFSGAISQQLNARTQGAELAVVRDVNLSLQFMTSSLDKVFEPSAPATSIDNRVLKHEIQSAIVMDSAMLATYQRENHPQFQELFGAFRKNCGPDGLVDNAFAFQLGGQNYVIMCPGLLVSAVGAGGDRESNFRNVLQTVTHELGHHIDAGRQPGVYPRFLNCLEENYAGRSASWVSDHAKEITADFWGTLAATEAMRSYQPAMNRDQKLRFLREVFSPLCDTPDDGKHPSGEFRLTALLRNMPGIGSELGCASTYGGKPMCLLGGAFRPLPVIHAPPPPVLKPILMPIPR